MENRILTNNISSLLAITGKSMAAEDGDCQGKWVYGAVMFFILTVGFLGNVLTIIVFLQKEQRCRVIAPFVINLAVADLLIVVFGYPVTITANLSCMGLTTGEPRCIWSAFVNGAIGITSIAMLTEISVLMCYNITSTNPTLTSGMIAKKIKIFALAGAWIYGILSMCPPLLGWSRFVPGAARISCGPEWGSSNIKALTYNIGLMVVGFFVPIIVILISYFKIYSSLTVTGILAEQRALIQRRRISQLKVVRMIGVTVLAFLTSWSPYCIVSLVTLINNTSTLSDGEAEIPELMAKASVIYNPLVYALMNADFRKTVKRLQRTRFCYGYREDSQATLDIERIASTKIQIVTVKIGNISSKKSEHFA